MRKVRRRKNHMNIMVLNEENQIEIVHVPNHLGDEQFQFDFLRLKPLCSYGFFFF